MIELPILALLKEKPLHGYELEYRLESLTGYLRTVSYGSLYPMLRKLEKRGHLFGTVEEQAAPSRTVFQITPDGEARFLRLMQDPGTPFALKMLFFQSIPSPDRKHLLEELRDEWVRKLEERLHDQGRIAGRPAIRYRAALLTRAVRHLEHDIGWIQNLVEGETQP